MKNTFKNFILVFFGLLIFCSSAFSFSFPSFERLDGDWEFYFEKTPESISSYSGKNPDPDSIEKIPGYWNKTLKKIQNEFNPKTFGSYRKEISNLNPQTEYAVLIKEAPDTSCCVFINGKEHFRNGDPFKLSEGKKSKLRDSKVTPVYCTFYPDSEGNIEIIILVSNYFYRKSGIKDSIFFGTSENISKINSYILMFFTVLTSVLLFIGILNIVQFLINKKAKEYLCLGISALVFACRSSTAGYCSLGIILPFITASAKIKIEYTALWLAPITILYAIYIIFPVKKDKLFSFVTHKLLMNIVLAAGCIIGLFTILLPAEYSNRLVPVLQFYQVVSSIYVTGLAVYHVATRKKYSFYYMLSCMILLAGSIIDTIYTKIRTFMPVSMFPIFLVGFIIVQLFMLASIQNDIYRKTKKVTKELTVLNKAYLKFVPKEFLMLINKTNIANIELGDHASIENPIMFSKISIESLTDNLDSEKHFFIFNEYLRNISPVIKNNNGFVSKFLSGGFMAIFTGSVKDAVEAGLMVINEVEKLKEKYKNENIELKIRIGLHYGKMIIGTIGEENRLDDTVISDTVNTASRIEAVCETLQKQFIVSSKVQELVLLDASESFDFTFKQLDSISVKGKTKPLMLYECTSGIEGKL